MSPELDQQPHFIYRSHHTAQDIHNWLEGYQAELDEQRLSVDSIRPTALVHILTPEFQGLNPQEFSDISDETVSKASADALQPSLYWKYIPIGRREEHEPTAFSYKSGDGETISVALTPEEYDKASESVEKLADRLYNHVLVQRTEKLRQETGNPQARARSEEDIRTAKRGAMRAVMDRQADMERLLSDGINPKIELIESFMEMASRRNRNLARGSREVVSRRFEKLRTTVFDDMIDAAALKNSWSEDKTAKAKRIIQKRLYISGSVSQRVSNFKEMLALAHDYYGHKRALILTKIEDARRYQRRHKEVVADIMAVDEERRLEKEAKRLSA